MQALIKTKFIAIAFIPLLMSGCGGGTGDSKRETVYPVSGKILLNGSPVAGATVTFSPQSGQPVAFGKTDSSGQYSLTTYDANDGAAAGDYVVRVSKSSGVSEGTPEEEIHEAVSEGGSLPMQHAGGGGAAEDGSLLPDKFDNPKESGLTATVTADGENKFDFDLQP